VELICDNFYAQIERINSRCLFSPRVAWTRQSAIGAGSGHTPRGKFNGSLPLLGSRFRTVAKVPIPANLETALVTLRPEKVCKLS
jgi:hypothetical protein